MALNITESNQVNKLLHWFLDDGKGPEGPDAPDEEGARLAAAALADSAHKALSAGLTGKDVYERWELSDE
jgi:hypothetical protein